MLFYRFTIIGNEVVAAEQTSLDWNTETLLISWDDPWKRYFTTVVKAGHTQNEQTLLIEGQRQYNEYLKRPFPVAFRERRPQN